MAKQVLDELNNVGVRIRVRENVARDLDPVHRERPGEARD